MEVFLAAAGGTWFAIFSLLILIVGIASAEYDSFVGGTATLLVGLLGADLIFGYPIFASILANPLLAVLAVALYVMVGSAYTGLWKWPDYIRSQAENIESSYGTWMSIRKENVNFDDFLDSREYNYHRASSNKERLSAWVLMWPFSMFWELARKPAKWAFNTTYEMLGTTFERVGKSTAKKMHEKNK